jgi:hypothetical protein
MDLMQCIGLRQLFRRGFPALKEIQQEIIRPGIIGPLRQFFPGGGNGLLIALRIQFAAQKFYAQKKNVGLENIGNTILIDFFQTPLPEQVFNILPLDIIFAGKAN